MTDPVPERDEPILRKTRKPYKRGYRARGTTILMAPHRREQARLPESDPTAERLLSDCEPEVLRSIRDLLDGPRPDDGSLLRTIHGMGRIPPLAYGDPEGLKGAAVSYSYIAAAAIVMLRRALSLAGETR